MSETEDYAETATPSAHAESHENAGADEVDVEGLSGELADEQNSAWAKVSGKPATYPPIAHKTSHEGGGTDELTDVVRKNGSEILTADWDIGDGRAILTDKIKARDSAGLLLVDDADNGIEILDGGFVLPASGALFPFPLLNIMKDSGRFAGDAQDPLGLLAPGAFAATTWFSPYNGSSAYSSAGKFISDNTTYGGTQGALTQDVIDLLAAMDRTGIYARYGVEFYIAQSTMGSGTATGYDSRYLFSTNAAKACFGKDNYTSWTFWIRIKTGGSILILFTYYLFKNAEPQAEDIILTTANGWTLITALTTAPLGYSNASPYIYANNGDVVQIACPMCFRGPVYPGYITAPIGSI